MKNTKTTEAIQLASSTNDEPEFLQVPQLFPRAGIKRGIAYRKIKDGTFESVVLREAGKTQGIRLVFWPSVKAYLHRLMAEQTEAIKKSGADTNVSE